MKKITKISVLFACTQFIILVCLCFVKLWFVVITTGYALIITPIIVTILDPIVWSLKKNHKAYKDSESNTQEPRENELANILFMRQLMKSKDPKDKKIGMQAAETYLKSKGKL